MPGDEKTKQEGRRSFFMDGLSELASAFREARGAMDEVAEEVREAAQAAMPDEPEDHSGRSFHRNRRRSAAPNQDWRALIRPPGAIPDPAFYEACSRCHHCVEACPEGVIFTAGPEHGPHQEFTPVLFLEQKACILCADVPCAQSCPSGALRAITLSELRLGVLELAEELCLNSRGEECARCMDACPIEGKAITVVLGSLPVIDPDRCTACGQCVVACVSQPKALAVRAPSTRQEGSVA